MTVEQRMTVDYWKQTLGQRDQPEAYCGKGDVKITATKVQVVDRGLVVFELERADWIEITRAIR